MQYNIRYNTTWHSKVHFYIENAQFSSNFTENLVLTLKFLTRQFSLRMAKYTSLMIEMSQIQKISILTLPISVAVKLNANLKFINL